MKRFFAHAPYLFLALVLIILVVASVLEMNRFSEDAAELRTASVAASIRKAAVQCYALEGSYPPDLQWLEAHYGLTVDTDHFHVVYQAFASNLMPEIEVLEK